MRDLRSSTHNNIFNLLVYVITCDKYLIFELKVLIANIRSIVGKLKTKSSNQG